MEARLLVTSFTTDWSASREHWPDLFAELGLLHRPGLRFLEVGCFEGQATLWLLENVLRDPESRITVVDRFDIERNDLSQYARFASNVEPHRLRVEVIVGSSQYALRSLDPDERQYDLVYVDGSHAAQDVLADAVLAWPLLRSGGTMLFDDYYWPEMPELDRPTIAVDAFAACYREQIRRHGPVGRDQYLIEKRES